MDRRDHEPVARVVEKSRGEGQPTAHVTERVIAHDCHMPEGVAQVAPGRIKVGPRPSQLTAQRLRLVDTVPNGVEHRLLAVAVDQRKATAEPAKAHVRADARRQSEHSRTRRSEGDFVEEGVVERQHGAAA